MAQYCATARNRGATQFPQAGGVMGWKGQGTRDKGGIILRVNEYTENYTECIAHREGKRAWRILMTKPERI